MNKLFVSVLLAMGLSSSLGARGEVPASAPYVGNAEVSVWSMRSYQRDGIARKIEELELLAATEDTSRELFLAIHAVTDELRMATERNAKLSRKAERQSMRLHNRGCGE